MLRIARDLCRRLWLVSLLLLAAAHVAAAGALSVGPDFDGDGQDDRGEFDRPEPSAPRSRLSATHVTIILRGEGPRVGPAAQDHDEGASAADSGASTQLALAPQSAHAAATRQLATRPLSDRARPASARLCASFSPRPPPGTPELQFARV